MSALRASLEGRRVPDGTELSEYKPGDYGRRGSYWWVVMPTGVLGRLDERWSVEEQADGRITVQPSLYDSPNGWHGWLTSGFWRSV